MRNNLSRHRRAVWTAALVLAAAAIVTAPLTASRAKYVAAGTGSASARIAAWDVGGSATFTNAFLATEVILYHPGNTTNRSVTFTYSNIWSNSEVTCRFSVEHFNVANAATYISNAAGATIPPNSGTGTTSGSGTITYLGNAVARGTGTNVAIDIGHGPVVGTFVATQVD